MTMAVVGVIINVLFSLLCINVGGEPDAFDSYGEAKIYAMFGVIGLISCAISILGLILAKTQDSPKLGSILVIVGSVLFVPAGLIAIFGAIKMKKPYEDAKNNEDFEARRQAYLERQKNSTSEKN